MHPVAWRPWLALALAAMSIASMAATVPVAEVPLLAKSLQPWITVDIDGAGHVDCIVDIGANFSVLPGHLLGKARYVQTLKVNTAAGAAPMRIKRVAWVQVAKARASGIDFIEQDQSWFDARDAMPCVLATNFLANFTVDFDGPGGTLRLFPAGTRIASIVGPDPASKNRVNASFGKGGLLTTRVQIQGVAAEADIDTGWGMATPNAALVAAAGFRKGDPRITTQWIGSPLTGNGRDYPVAQFSGLRIGAVSEEKIDVALPEARTQAMDAGGAPHLQLGWGVLRAHRMLIDWKHKELVLMP